jgi:DNA-binding NarL/FixJ family response regulator
MADKGTVLLVGQNLFFLGRVENLAEPLGYQVRRATSERAFWNHCRAGTPALVLVDLEGDSDVWSQVLESIGQQQEPPGYKIVAFGPHEDVATMERARNLGCDLALSKGEFNRDLPKIIEALGDE